MMRRGQFMMDKTQENHAIRSKHLLNKLKHPEEPDVLWIFLDENSDRNQMLNRRNKKWLCASPPELPMVTHTKCSSAVMVLGAMSNKGHVMPSTSYHRVPGAMPMPTSRC